MTLPNTQRAVIQDKTPGALTLTQTRSLPNVEPGQILVKTAAVALNPCDWKMPTNFPCPGAGVGSDYAGTVVALGEGVDESTLKVGDRVAGAVHASNRLDPQSGAFAEYIAVWADQIWQIPDSMSWEEAAAIGWCVVGTVGMTIFRTMAMPGSPEEPAKRPSFALVYGGSTASGTMAIQILKLSGFRVITTCSPRNFQMVESYGAEKAFDYNSPTCADDIRQYTKNSLRYAIDIIAEAKTLKMCYSAIGRAGGHYVGFELIPQELIADMRKTVKADWVLGIRMSGREIALDKGYGSAPDAELREWGVSLFQRMEKIIQAGKIRSHPRVVNRTGLDEIIAGIDRMRRRDVSGQKLVYLIDGQSQSAPVPTPAPVLNTKTYALLPQQQQSLKIQGQGTIALKDAVILPPLQPHEVMVKVVCVALNPEDWKSADMSPAIGATSGCDFAGEVVKIGSAVTRSFIIGDRVCGCVFGNNPDERDNGSFSNYVVAAADLIWKIPAELSFEAASTLGVGVGTVGMAVYNMLQIEMPTWPAKPVTNESKYVLVYGGGTATGGLAIQLIRMSGLIPITTASHSNFNRLKSLGAAMTFDYRSPTCGNEIKTFTKGTLEYAFDCISTTESMKICYSAIGTKGGKYIALDHFPPRAHTRRDVHPEWMLLFTMFNKPISWQPPYYREARPKDRQFAVGWFEVTQGLLDLGAIVPPRYERMDGGLAGIVDGIDMVRKGRHNGVKLVYRLVA